MSRKPNQFAEQARIAYTYSLPKDHQRVEHKSNIIVYNFLLEVAEKFEAEGRHEDGTCRNAKKACGSVQCCVRRIYDKQCLESLKFVGPALANKVHHSLWAQFPPDPPSQEEQDAWAQALQSRSKSKASATGKSKAAGATPAPAAPSPPVPQEQQQSQTQPRKLPKPYFPRKGTAAYTFLICLFREKARGRPVLSKDELLSMGEDSNLAKEPLRNASAAAEAARGNYHKTYGGWSCMKDLANRDPPLIQKWSNPIKVRLTPEGVELGERLFALAAAHGDIEPLPGVDHNAILLAGGSTDAGAAAAAAATPAAPAAPPAAAAASSRPAAGGSGDPTKAAAKAERRAAVVRRKLAADAAAAAPQPRPCATAVEEVDAGAAAGGPPWPNKGVRQAQAALAKSKGARVAPVAAKSSKASKRALPDDLDDDWRGSRKQAAVPPKGRLPDFDSDDDDMDLPISGRRGRFSAVVPRAAADPVATQDPGLEAPGRHLGGVAAVAAQAAPPVRPKVKRRRDAAGAGPAATPRPGAAARAADLGCVSPLRDAPGVAAPASQPMQPSASPVDLLSPEREPAPPVTAARDVATHDSSGGGGGRAGLTPSGAGGWAGGALAPLPPSSPSPCGWARAPAATPPRFELPPSPSGSPPAAFALPPRSASPWGSPSTSGGRGGAHRHAVDAAPAEQGVPRAAGGSYAAAASARATAAVAAPPAGAQGGASSAVIDLISSDEEDAENAGNAADGVPKPDSAIAAATPEDAAAQQVQSVLQAQQGAAVAPPRAFGLSRPVNARAAEAPAVPCTPSMTHTPPQRAPGPELRSGSAAPASAAAPHHCVTPAVLGRMLGAAPAGTPATRATPAGIRAVPASGCVGACTSAPPVMHALGASPFARAPPPGGSDIQRLQAAAAAWEHACASTPSTLTSRSGASAGGAPGTAGARTGSAGCATHGVGALGGAGLAQHGGSTAACGTHDPPASLCRESVAASNKVTLPRFKPAAPRRDAAVASGVPRSAVASSAAQADAAAVPTRSAPAVAAAAVAQRGGVAGAAPASAAPHRPLGHAESGQRSWVATAIGSQGTAGSQARPPAAASARAPPLAPSSRAAPAAASARAAAPVAAPRSLAASQALGSQCAGSQGLGSQGLGSQFGLGSQGLGSQGLGSQGGSQPVLRRTTTDTWKLATLRVPDPGSGGGDGGAPASLREPPIPPGCLFRDVYDIVTVMDTREKLTLRHGGGQLDAHLAAMQRLGIDVEKRDLPVGDVAWIARCTTATPGGPDVGAEFMTDWVCERKSTSDLVGSIHDSRYDRQKIMMARCGLRVPCYVLEGDPGNLRDSESAVKAVKTASWETEIHSGFKVLRTGRLEDTLMLYGAIQEQLRSLYRSLPRGGRAGAEALPTFAEWHARCKQSMVQTLRDVWTQMLIAAKGVGGETAEAIVRQYPTPISLFRAYDECKAEAEVKGQNAEAACVRLLAVLPVTLTRKIGPSAAGSVYRNLFQLGWHK
eukprot:jgi/Ulvmu1/813/UM010_0187.1